jgi:predicted nuclease of predicted toxin-antitoxin system
VKLLFDQNLPPRLVANLADLFPGSLHVRDAGLARADDESVWKFALDRGFAIVTKDSDFQERSQIARLAPRVIWIRRGNCSTSDLEMLMRNHAHRIAALEREPDWGFLILL